MQMVFSGHCEILRSPVDPSIIVITRDHAEIQHLARCGQAGGPAPGQIPNTNIYGSTIENTFCGSLGEVFWSTGISTDWIIITLAAPLALQFRCSWKIHVLSCN